jgi:hypothetical protein
MHLCMPILLRGPQQHAIVISAAYHLQLQYSRWKLCRLALQLQLQPELEGTLERGALLRADGEALAAQHTAPARAELALNPSRFESWEMYAGESKVIIHEQSLPE